MTTVQSWWVLSNIASQSIDVTLASALRANRLLDWWQSHDYSPQGSERRNNGPATAAEWKRHQASEPHVLRRTRIHDQETSQSAHGSRVFVFAENVPGHVFGANIWKHPNGLNISSKLCNFQRFNVRFNYNLYGVCMKKCEKFKSAIKSLKV